MSTLQQLSNDMIILVLKELEWVDIYNFCLVNPDICQDPRIQEFIQKRAKEISQNMFNIAFTTTTTTTTDKTYNLRSLIPNIVYTINKMSSPDNFNFRISRLSPDLLKDGPIYEFYEEHFRIIDNRLIDISSLKVQLDSLIMYNGHIIARIYVKNREDIEKIIADLLLKGKINE